MRSLAFLGLLRSLPCSSSLSEIRQPTREHSIFREKQQLFDLGVTSHMANVAFDKHVEFSEKYISTMQEGLC